MRDCGFPEPQANVVAAGRLVDFHWPKEGVAVELDSWTFHRQRRSFDGDRRGDIRLQAAGQRPVRVTQRHLTDDRAALVLDLAALLSPAP